MNHVAVGTKAPNFNLPSTDGHSINLFQYGGKKVLIGLLRNAKCAICNLWVANAAKRSESWREQGLEVLAIFESTPEKLQNQFSGRSPGFRILADPDGSVHELLGSRNDPAQVNEVISKGHADGAMKEAAEKGFIPVMEDGANFFRIPSELLLDEEGIIRAVHHSNHIFDHLSEDTIQRFVVL